MPPGQQLRSGTTLNGFVMVQGLASAALAFFRHRLWCSLSVSCASIETQRQHVVCPLNHINPSPTFIFAVNFGRRCFLWPHLHVNSATYILAVLNSSRRLLAHSMLVAAHLASIVTTWLTSYPATTQPRSSTKDSSSAADTYSLRHLISPEV